MSQRRRGNKTSDSSVERKELLPTEAYLLWQESRGAGEAPGPGPVALRAGPLGGALAGRRHQLDQAVGEDGRVKGVRAESGGR